MGKKNKKNSSKFFDTTDLHSIKPFQNSNNEENTTNYVQERSSLPKEEISDKDKDFHDLLSKQLFEYLESRIKIIDIPEENLDLIQFETKEVPLLLGSPLMVEDTITEMTETPPPQPKKKRKKEKKSEKECFKEVAVTADWLEKQAKLFNS